MKNNISIPNVPFYFVRHGQTDWNKNKNTQNVLCPAHDISLNETGIEQAKNACLQVKALNISKIYSSPLARAQQTAEIINEQLKLPLELQTGLGKITPVIIAETMRALLNKNEGTLLIVSHGEVYRVLLQILKAQTQHANAQNGGVYHFNVDNSGNWIIESFRL